ncbi:uncharacterized protein involved in response to NO [Sinobacterium caligoides]|uniref:Uncharacterized protein involved in response to NO n=1 Tax=Sinobacterium caligoides TaxID=933926 RepID=A0A3N2E056_9GAMM|nr:NnrS family protein [Sinobacterium caligoides]ROS05481.1 uncharacterized protein involved in response to NO [Sinobacterium caligoides]
MPSPLTIKEPDEPKRTKMKLNADGSLRPAEPEPLSKSRQLLRQPLLDLAFRPGFLLASLASIFSLTLWLLYLHGLLPQLQHNTLSPLAWHIHEMLFAFAATVAVAFLLTAAQTWTNQRSLHGGGLLIFCLLWLSVQLLLLTGNSPTVVIATITAQTLWWSIAIGCLARMVFKARSRRNYQFVVILFLMMALNLGIFAADIAGNYALTIHLAISAILVFSLLAGIMGGRVIPFFTRRGAPEAAVTDTPRLNRLCPPVAVVAIVIYFASYFTSYFSTAISGSLLIVAGTLYLLQLSHWHSWATRKVPLLWSLHASYFALGLGLILVGVSTFKNYFPLADALHVITIGAIGAMILAMIARVSLGHTGRPLQPHPVMAIAFALTFLAALLRFVLPQLGLPILAWDISASLWGIAFGCFLWHYTPILFKPRQS